MNLKRGKKGGWYRPGSKPDKGICVRSASDLGEREGLVLGEGREFVKGRKGAFLSKAPDSRIGRVSRIPANCRGGRTDILGAAGKMKKRRGGKDGALEK